MTPELRDYFAPGGVIHRCLPPSPHDRAAVLFDARQPRHFLAG